MRRIAVVLTIAASAVLAVSAIAVGAGWDPLAGSITDATRRSFDGAGLLGVAAVL